MPSPPPQTRAPLLWWLIPWLAGTAAAAAGLGPASPPACLALALGASIAALAAARHATPATTVTFHAALALASAAAGAGALHDRRNLLPEAGGLPPREAVLTIHVTRLLAPGDPTRRSLLGTVTGTPRHLAAFSGQTLLASIDRLDAPAAASVLRGARLRIRGRLDNLQDLPAADRSGFEAYAFGIGANFALSRGRLVGIDQPPPAWSRACAAWGDRLESHLRSGLEGRPDIAGIYVAMLLGRKAALSDDQELRYARSGSLHLFAISGLNIGVFAFALHTLLSVLRVPRPLAAIAGLALLWGFVQVTGASPSALRAYLMAVFAWLAGILGRPQGLPAALAASAVAVLIIDARQALDPGFQLSYAVVAGIALAGLPLATHASTRLNLTRLIPRGSAHRTLRLADAALRTTASASAVALAAFAASAPLSISLFGTLTPASIPSSLILVPLASGVVIAGCTSIVAGTLALAPLATLANQAAALLIAGMDAAAAAIAAMPGLHWELTWRHPAFATATTAATALATLTGASLGWPKPWPWIAPGLLAAGLLCGTLPATTPPS